MSAVDCEQPSELRVEQHTHPNSHKITMTTWQFDCQPRAISHLKTAGERRTGEEVRRSEKEEGGEEGETKRRREEE